MFGQPLARYVAAVVAGGAVCLVALVATGGLSSTLATPSCCSWSAARWSPSSPRQGRAARRRGRDHRVEHLRVRAASVTAWPRGHRFALGTILADGGIRRKPPSRIAFNAAQYVITVAAAGVVLSALSTSHLEDPTGIEPSDLLGIVAAALVFHALNSSFVAGAIALAEKIGFLRYLAPTSSCRPRPPACCSASSHRCW